MSWFSPVKPAALRKGRNVMDLLRQAPPVAGEGRGSEKSCKPPQDTEQSGKTGARSVKA